MRTFRRTSIFLLVLACAVLLPHSVRGDFLVILDHSGSMGSAKAMEPAKEALRQAMAELSTPGAFWGLRVYGTGCCSPDTELMVPLSRDGRARIAEILPGVQGIAGSPMPAALRAAREGELRERRALWRRQDALVVSDGEVDREGACREARLLRQDGVRVTIIGLEYAGTPTGSENLRYIATHPDCAAGTYIRVERPDLLTQALLDWSAAIFGLPFRMMALFLAVVAGYYTTKFVEYALERLTRRLGREWIPRLCQALFLFWILASGGIFFTLPVWLWLTLALVPALSFLVVARTKDALFKEPIR